MSYDSNNTSRNLKGICVLPIRPSSILHDIYLLLEELFHPYLNSIIFPTVVGTIGGSSN